MIKTGHYDKSLHDKEFKVYLRYSDHSRPCWYFNKRVSTKDIFLNTVKVFGSNNINIILDNSSEETYNWLKERVGSESKVIETSAGSAGSFITAMLNAMDSMEDDSIVYFLEDDYIHKPNSSDVILEGLSHFDYVTLLDSFYKYTDRDRDSERKSYIKASESCHWRSITTTNSTWACRLSTLKEDFLTHASWLKINPRQCNDSEELKNIFSGINTQSADIERPRRWRGEIHLWDRLLENGRSLGQPIPSYSDHINERHRKLHAPFTNWMEILFNDNCEK